MGSQTDGRETVTEDIHLTTLDQFANENNLSRLDFIRADIEGWEAHFLRGAMTSIKRFRPAIMMEVITHILARAGSMERDIFDFLLSLDYSVFKTFEYDGCKMKPVSDFDGSGDYLFAPKKKVALVSVGEAQRVRRAVWKPSSPRLSAH